MLMDPMLLRHPTSSGCGCKRGTADAEGSSAEGWLSKFHTFFFFIFVKLRRLQAEVTQNYGDEIIFIIGRYRKCKWLELGGGQTCDPLVTVLLL